MTNHSKAVYFNANILGITDRKLGFVKEEEFRLSLHQLREEIDEMEGAYLEGNLVKMIDAMIDLNYFLCGVIYKHGIPEGMYDQMFDVVHQANMAKAIGKKKGRDQYDALDAIKPQGWIPPEETLTYLIAAALGGTDEHEGQDKPHDGTDPDVLRVHGSDASAQGVLPVSGGSLRSDSEGISE